MRTYLLLALAILAFVAYLPAVESSASVGIPPVSERQLEPIPGTSKTWSYSVGGASNVDVNIEGDYVEYAKLDDPDPGGPPRVVSVTWNVPDEITPGVHVLRLRVAEAAPEGVTVGARASAGVPMYMTKYADYPFITAEMEVPSQEVGMDNKAIFTLKSLSNVDTPGVMARITQYEINEPVQGMTLEANLGTVPPLGETRVEVPLSTKTLTKGQYSARAQVTYPQGAPIDRQSDFRIGAFSMSLVKSPEKLYRGKINKVEFVLGNDWNQQLSDSRIRLIIDSLGVEEKAPYTTFVAFGQVPLIFYVEPDADTPLGPVEGYIEVTVDAKNPRDKFTMPFRAEIVDASEEEASEQVVTERPSAFGFLNPLTGAYLVVALLVVINIILLMRQRGKQGKEDTRIDESHGTRSGEPGNAKANVVKTGVKAEVKNEVKAEVKTGVKADVKNDVKK